MKQLGLGLNLSTKKTRKREFLEEIERSDALGNTGTAVDATLIAAPSSTKNSDGERDPEMKQTRKGNTGPSG